METLVALPDEAKVLIFSLLTTGVLWVLLKLSEVTGVDLKGYAEPIAAVLAPIIVALIESYLQLIPPLFDNLVLSLIHLLVLLLGGSAIFFFATKRRAPSLK